MHKMLQHKTRASSQWVEFALKQHHHVRTKSIMQRFELPPDSDDVTDVGALNNAWLGKYW